MSSDAAAYSAAVTALYDILYTNEYCGLAASALFIYDAVVTFDQEVAYFWGAGWSGASLLFFANKGISLILYVLVLVGLTSLPSDEPCAVGSTMIIVPVRSCSLFQKAFLAAPVLQIFPWAAFSALRGYVLSKSKLLGLLIFALSVVPAGVNLVPAAKEPSVTIISRVPLVVADILLIYITWTKLSNGDVLRGIRRSKRLSLPNVLLRDGTVYFVVLLILNGLHLTLEVLSVALTADNTSYVPIFTGPMTAILVSRFLLQLQEASHTILRVDSDDPLHISMGPYDGTPSFIRSLGAVLDPDGLREDHADLDETNPRPDIEEEERTEQIVVQSSAS
ncbi:hypothetical protein K466DRAFT_666337 [Polyporus arcularius HHB13444]|uniref:DUF6533 domain-containing protein n=1 Tax=Polyporus arcularius HHB13444 TaxID=1314778 RepID=A0A5C3P1H4_9APHY|nr:hypothetical protein K466DRAFT_666337 [Polyporus arcularius HHB13444]